MNRHSRESRYHWLRRAGAGALLAGCALGLTACSTEGSRKLPGVYRINIQQGNIIEQEMLDRLRPGMDKEQVRFIMGTPAIEDPFHKDRWDYIFTFSKGGARREQRHIILYFQDDKLSHVAGDVVPGERKTAEATRRTAAIEVDPRRKERGLFSRLFNALPFVGDDDKPRPQPAETPAEPQPEAVPPAEGGDVFEP